MSPPLALAVLLILILIGPAQGFTLLLNLDNTTPNQGELVVFTAEIDVPTGERLPISQLTLSLEGPEKAECKFLPNGQILEGCKGISIAPIQSPSYGYGYNYGYGYTYGHGYSHGYNWGYSYGYTQGKLVYTITLDTTHYQAGIYSTLFTVKIKNNEFTKSGNNLTIKPLGSEESTGSRVCETVYECTEWSECTDKLRTRTCTKEIPYCMATQEKPVEREICFFPSIMQPQNLASENPPQEHEPKPEEYSETEDLKHSLGSRITGAITGVVGTATLGDLFLVIMIFVTIAIILTITIWVRKIKRRLRAYPAK